MTQLSVSPARPKSKRPAAVSPVDDGTNTGIISESPKKKAKKAAPKAPDVGKQPAVSFSDRIIRPSSPSSLRRLDFGTISSDEELPASIANLSSLSQKRSRKPSAKAAYMSSPRSLEAPASKSAKGASAAIPLVKIKLEPGSEVIAALDSAFEDGVENVVSSVPKKIKRPAAEPILVLDSSEEEAVTDDQDDLESEGELTLPPNQIVAASAPAASDEDMYKSDSGDDIEAQIAALRRKQALKKELKTKKEKLPSSHSVEEPKRASLDLSRARMPLKHLEPDPIPLDHGVDESNSGDADDLPGAGSGVAGDDSDVEAHLPTLPSCDLRPIARDPAPASSMFLRLDLVREHIDESDYSLIQAAHEFVSFPPFVNLSRADPASFVVDGSHRLCWNNPRRNAVGIMLGSVATCNLVNPHNYSTNIEGGYIVRKISITPTNVTYRRFAGFLGAKFRWAALKAPVDGGNEITFSTRKKGATGGPIGSPVRQKNPKFYGPSPHAAGTKDGTGWYGGPFPPFLDFDSGVPIYDARDSNFTFDKVGFDSLKELPQYRVKGVRQNLDLPADSLVAVAYTANIYGIPRPSGSNNDQDMMSEPSASDACPTLSLNVHFVVLLGHLV